MADTNVSVSTFSPGFVQELSPVAQKIALLYYLSYLCLGKFPKLERTIRSRAVETQTLFGYSDATMMKCVLTSDNLVTSLFPMLTVAVEKNKTTLAVKFLGKAQTWITDIIKSVEEVVKRYDSHSNDLTSAASDVIFEKAETDKKIKEQDQELKGIEESLRNRIQLRDNKTKEIVEIEVKINSKTQEIQELVKSKTKANDGLGIVAAVVPFLGTIIKSIYNAAKNPEEVAQLKALESQLNVLIAEKTALKQNQWQVELQIIDWQMKVAKASFEKSSIPNPIYLPQVQKSLTIIRDILGELLNFWLNVRNLLVALEQKTFAGEDFLDEFDTFKYHFLDSMQKAKEAWISFGEGCKKASVIFRLQNKDAYKFLEVNPSSLSKEQWQIQYESVKKQLEEIDPQLNLPTVGPTLTIQPNQTSSVAPA